jgi:hypothetical protein
MGQANVKMNKSAAPPGTSTTTTTNSVPRAVDEMNFITFEAFATFLAAPLV